MKKKHQTECSNYVGVSLVGHAGKMLIKIIARRPNGEYFESAVILSDGQSGF